MTDKDQLENYAEQRADKSKKVRAARLRKREALKSVMSAEMMIKKESSIKRMRVKEVKTVKRKMDTQVIKQKVVVTAMAESKKLLARAKLSNNKSEITKQEGLIKVYVTRQTKIIKYVTKYKSQYKTASKKQRIITRIIRKVTRNLQKAKKYVVKETKKIHNAKILAVKTIKKKLVRIVKKKVASKAHKTFQRYKKAEKKLKVMIMKGKSSKIIKKYMKRLKIQKKKAVLIRKTADAIVRGGKKMQRAGKKQEMDKPLGAGEFKAKMVAGQTFYEAKIQMKVLLQPGKPFKLKIKPELQSDQTFGSVKMGGFGYSVQAHHKNPANIPKKESGDFNKPVAEESDEVGEIDVVGEILGENSSLSLRDLKQTILKITMVKILPPETQKM